MFCQISCAMHRIKPWHAEARTNKQKTCDVDIGENFTIVRVALDRVMSEVACMYSPSPVLVDYKTGDPGLYGWTAKAVWVSRGCSARFKVCYKGKNNVVRVYDILTGTLCKYILMCHFGQVFKIEHGQWSKIKSLHFESVLDIPCLRCFFMLFPYACWLILHS